MTEAALLVTVGTDHHPFSRLIDWVEGWLTYQSAERVDCLVQHGTSRPPKLGRAVAHLGYDDLQEAMANASIVVCHAGPASVMEARRAGVLPIVVPRDPRLGEHVDGHQIAFARHLHTAGVAISCESQEALHAALTDALTAPDRYALPAGTWAAGAEGAHRAGQLIDTLLAARRGRRPAESSPVDLPEPGEWPAVSVVIPTRNRPVQVRQAAEAVLDQDYPGRIHCVIVYDGGEADPSLKAERPLRRLSVLTNDRTPGLAGARNTGILAADTQLVAFCDDDDVWLPGKLRSQVAALAARPDAVVACCGITVAYGDTEVDRLLPWPQIHLVDLLRSRLTELHPSTFLIRRDAVVDGIGLVSEEIPGCYGEDYEFLIRAARQAPIVNVARSGVRVLWSAGSYFSGRWETIASALTWLLDRYPEFRLVRTGYARVAGQIAFAYAATGQRRSTLRWIGRTIRANPGEARAYLASTVLVGLVRPDRIVRALHRRGRGI